MTPGATERQKFSPLKVVPGSALQRRPPRPLEHATSTHKLGPVRPRYDEGINQLSRQSIVRACKLHFTSLRADRYGACLLAGRAGESPARAPQPTRLPRGRGRLCLFSCRSARERGWGGGRRARRGARRRGAERARTYRRRCCTPRPRAWRRPGARLGAVAPARREQAASCPIARAAGPGVKPRITREAAKGVARAGAGGRARRRPHPSPPRASCRGPGRSREVSFARCAQARRRTWSGGGRQARAEQYVAGSRVACCQPASLDDKKKTRPRPRPTSAARPPARPPTRQKQPL